MEIDRRPHGWLFFFVLILIWLGCLQRIVAAGVPSRTAISDIVYRADGTPASGSVTVTWPAFTGADGTSVAAGTLTQTIGAGGLLNLSLVPNAGATPGGSFYTIVLHLTDGKTSTEYWTVPIGTTVKISDVRAKVVPQSVATQTVSPEYVRSYVDSAIQAATPGTKGMVAVAPVADQAITQPPGTSFKVNRVAAGNLNSTRFADQFPDIQSAITDAGETGSVTIPANYSGVDTYTNPNMIQIDDRRKQRKPEVNAVVDCGVPPAPADGCAALTACVAANPGREIRIPAVNAGHSLSNPDIYSSCTVFSSSNLFRGEGGGYQGGQGTIIKFAAGISGFVLTGTASMQSLVVVGSEAAPTHTGSTDTSALIVPGKDLLPEYHLKPDLVVRSAGITTLKWTNRWHWFQNNGLITVEGMSDSTMNGTYYVDSIGYTSNYSYLTYSQTGAPDVAEVAGGASAIVKPSTTGTSAADGITIGAAIPLRNVFVYGFGRHCINVAGASYIADDFSLSDVWAYACRGHGLLARGVDANAGEAYHFKGYFNMLYGIFDIGFLGNAYYSPQLSYNHTGGVNPTAGSAKSCSSISRSVGVITATCNAHGLAIGNAAYFSGFSDSSFNSRAGSVGCFVSTVTANTLSCTQPGYNLPNATSSGGTVRLPSMGEVFVGAAIDGGSFTTGRHNFAGNWIFTRPYVEGGQDSANNGNSIRLNSNVVLYSLHSGDNVDPRFVPGAQYRANTLTIDTQYYVRNKSDDVQHAGFNFYYDAGTATDQNYGLRFQSKGVTKWTNYFVNNSSTNSVGWYNGDWPTKPRLQFSYGGFGYTNLNSDGSNAIRFNSDTNSGTGGLECYSGGASPTKVCSIDSVGKATFNGGVLVNTTTAKPTCAVAIRGMIWTTQGAAGTKDSVEVCAKDAANAYAWRTLY